MHEQKYTLDVLGHPIYINFDNTGDGINVLIAGGERAHIGAVSVKRPGEELITQEFPTHRDSTVSDKWALTLSNRYDTPVVVSAGIHYDNITKDQIALILNALDELLAEL